MTAVDVDALDAARAAATAGPWREGAQPYVYTEALDGLPVVADCYVDADAALIVAAVNALPELLAEVRRGRALRETVEGLAAREDFLGSHLVTTDEIRAALDPS